MNTRQHWQNVYHSKADQELGWFQQDPQPSLRLIIEASKGTGRVIDVGGGSSHLIDHLLDHPFDRLAVLDVSATALDRAKSRLGPAGRVEWIEGDVTAIPELGQFDVWHDRAVFHFLTEAHDRGRYV